MLSFPVRAAASLALVAFVAGCAGFERTSLEQVDSLGTDTIRSVTVLPVIDGRSDPFQYVVMALHVHDATVKALRDRGWFTLTQDSFREEPATGLDLRVASAEELMRLAPEDCDHFVVVKVEKVGETRDPSGQTVDATLSAAMVDREHARVVWRDVATANSNLSGFLTPFRAPSREYEAAENAARALVSTLPDLRPGKQKR